MNEEQYRKKLEAGRRYRHSEKGKLMAAVYRLANKEKHKAYKKSAIYKTYLQSDKYKQSQKELRQTDECKEYHKEYHKKYKQTEKHKQYQKEYKQSEHGKQVQREYQRTPKRKEYHKQYQKEYRASVHGKAWTKKWNQSPLAKYLNLKKKLLRRERENNCKHSFTKDEWKLKCEGTKGICPCCYYLFDDGRYKLSLDHTPSLAIANKNFKLTGTKQIYTINEVAPLCLRCNILKGDKDITLEELRKIVIIKPKGLYTS